MAKRRSRKTHRPQPVPVITTANPTRLDWLDTLRGVAIGLMVVYHFCYDLVFFRLAVFDFQNHWGWLSFRAFIVSLFLFAVGCSLQLAHQQQIHWQRWLKRQGWLLACAILVTAVSIGLFSSRFIFFGILHFILLASLVGLLFLRSYWLTLVAAAACLVLGNTLQAEFFNHPGLQWLGFMTHKPATEDYVPFLPWFGVVLLGMFCIQFLQAQAYSFPSMPSWTRLLQTAGRHGLLIYMLHQPLLLGAMYLLLGFNV